MSLKDEEADGHRCICLSKLLVLSCEELRESDEVSEGLAHLLSFYRDHVVVHPVADSGSAA